MKYETVWSERSFRNLSDFIEVDDDLNDLLLNMYSKIVNKFYGKANEILEKVKEILETPLPDWSAPYDPGREYGRTLLAVHDRLRMHSIRLNWMEMDLRKYLQLLVRVKVIVAGRQLTDEQWRSIVAKEMISLELLPQDGRGRKAPNRAFMDVLFRLNPQFARNDLLRRESTKMWYAIGSEDETAVKAIRDNIKEIKETEVN